MKAIAIVQAIEEAANKVTNIQVVKNNVTLKIFEDDSLTMDQKKNIIAYLSPIDDAINKARNAFIISSEEA